MSDYKKPPPVVYNCEELEEDTDEFEICTIKKSLQNEEITEEEARVRLEPLEEAQEGRLLQDDDLYTKLWDSSTLTLPEVFDTDQLIQDINYDEICTYFPKKKRLGNLFADKDAMELFDEYFNEKCLF